jgi:hypothetical protein
MKNLELSEFGVLEMSNAEMMNTAGEYSWVEFCGDAGYTVGYMVGAATNAADKLGKMIFETLVTDSIPKVK